MLFLNAPFSHQKAWSLPKKVTKITKMLDNVHHTEALFIHLFKWYNNNVHAQGNQFCTCNLGQKVLRILHFVMHGVHT